MSADTPEQGKKDVSLNFSLPDAERQAVYDWAHKHHMTRSAAARCMLRFALANGVQPDEELDLRKKSVKKARKKPA